MLIKAAEEARKETIPIFKSEVARGSDPYVPMDTGALALSVTNSLRGSGTQLIYKMPYAAKQYYTAPNKSIDLHPQASMQWFEKWKSSEGESLIDRIDKIWKKLFDTAKRRHH